MFSSIYKDPNESKDLVAIIENVSSKQAYKLLKFINKLFYQPQGALGMTLTELKVLYVNKKYKVSRRRHRYTNVLCYFRFQKWYFPQSNMRLVKIF